MFCVQIESKLSTPLPRIIIQGEKNEFKMDSDLFLHKFNEGELGDDLRWFDWYASIRGKKLWEKKYRILSELSWNE